MNAMEVLNKKIQLILHHRINSTQNVSTQHLSNMEVKL